MTERTGAQIGFALLFDHAAALLPQPKLAALGHSLVVHVNIAVLDATRHACPRLTLPRYGLVCPEFLCYGPENSEGSMMADTPDQAMTVRDVAGYLNVDEKTVYRLAKRGDLPGFKVAGAWRFKRSDLDSWIDLQKKAAQTKA